MGKTTHRINSEQNDIISNLSHEVVSPPEAACEVLSCMLLCVDCVFFLFVYALFVMNSMFCVTVSWCLLYAGVYLLLCGGECRKPKRNGNKSCCARSLFY